MTLPRENQVALEATSFYHCYVRCVRRAYLCGTDRDTGQNYEHRKQWLVSRFRFLSYIYAIDICAYAVMSNHYHVVLHVDRDRAVAWSDEEVVDRWLQLYGGSQLVDRWRAGPEALSHAEIDKVKEVIAVWRERLYDISWFMRGINEKIARMANQEDNCKGRFWEGRFRSQALLDEGALLSCMAYVDLNPVRAGIANGPCDSDYTSIQQRIYDYSGQSRHTEPQLAEIRERTERQQAVKADLELDHLPEAPLMPFDGSSHTDVHAALPFTQADYFELVDATGRIIREDKRGAISSGSRRLLDRLGIDSDKWIGHVVGFGSRHANCAGSAADMRRYCALQKRKWSKGTSMAIDVYRKSA